MPRKTAAPLREGHVPLDIGDLRNVARSDPAATATGATSASGTSGGGAGPAAGSNSNIEGIFFVLGLLIVCAGVYWWRYVTVPLGAFIVWTVMVNTLYESTLEVGQKWIVGIFGTALVVLTASYLWIRHWPGPSGAFNQNAAYSAATWKCADEVNVREGAGAGSPGKGARSPLKFKQACQGTVFVLKDSEAFVTQSDGIQKKWVRVKTQYGEGWVNRDFVSD